MDLEQVTSDTRYTSIDTMDVPAGERIRFGWTPTTTVFLDVTVPEGKVWRMLVAVDITELDAE